MRLILLIFSHLTNGQVEVKALTQDQTAKKCQRKEFNPELLALEVSDLKHYIYNTMYIVEPCSGQAINLGLFTAPGSTKSTQFLPAFTFFIAHLFWATPFSLALPNPPGLTLPLLTKVQSGFMDSDKGQSSPALPLCKRG